MVSVSLQPNILQPSDLPTGVQVAFDPASYTVLEGNQVSLTIVKTGAADIPVTVELSTAGISATGTWINDKYLEDSNAYFILWHWIW